MRKNAVIKNKRKMNIEEQGKVVCTLWDLNLESDVSVVGPIRTLHPHTFIHAQIIHSYNQT